MPFADSSNPWGMKFIEELPSLSMNSRYITNIFVDGQWFCVSFWRWDHNENNFWDFATFKDLKLSVITQGPSYRWNIKISQLKCDQVAKLPSEVKCGIGNINGLSGKVLI